MTALKTVFDRRCYTMDFSGDLDATAVKADETIYSVTVEIAVTKGVDANANAMLDGDPIISEDGKTVGQWVINGVLGAKYDIGFKVVGTGTGKYQGDIDLMVVAANTGIPA